MRFLVVPLVLLVSCATSTKNNERKDAATSGDDATGDDGGLPDARLVDAHLIDAPIDAPIVLVDAPPDAPVAVACNVLTQTGCTTTEKCSWILDTSTTGHSGCSPNGSTAVGGACAFGTPGPAGYDNCLKGSVCNSGTCKTICNNQGGAPACGSTFSCVPYSGLFDNTTPTYGGVCDPKCDPLNDNDIKGSGSRPGTACSAGQGCYGYPSDTTATSAFSCSAEISTTLVHRSPISGTIYLNSCAQGYIPLMYESTGSTQVVCVAMCKPGNTYSGNAGTQAPNGASPHRCNTTDARGAFGTSATTTTNGEHCAYSWIFEVDTGGVIDRSTTTDTLGFCIDHTKYQYDSDNNGTNDANWPTCASLPLTSATSVTAGDFGCVDSVSAGFFTGGGHHVRPTGDLHVLWPETLQRR